MIGRAAMKTRLLCAICAAACAAQPNKHEAKPEQAPAAAAETYSGHGAASVSKEILDKYAPKPLPDDLARGIQAMLDVRAPGSGILAPDGGALFFSWRVTGVSQIWRLEGPMRFPVQLTGGQ